MLVASGRRTAPKRSSDRRRVGATQIVDDRAIRAVIATASVDQMRERIADRLQFANFPLHLLQMLFGQFLDISARASSVAVECDQAFEIFDREAQPAGAA